MLKTELSGADTSYGVQPTKESMEHESGRTFQGAHIPGLQILGLSCAPTSSEESSTSDSPMEESPTFTNLEVLDDSVHNQRCCCVKSYYSASENTSLVREAASIGIHVLNLQKLLFLLGPLRAILACSLRQSVSLRRYQSDETVLTSARYLVQHWQQVFEARGVPEARESSESIVSFVLGAKTFQSLPAHCVVGPVSDEQLREVQRLSTKRLQRMPVQYAIGEWDFGDMTLKMRPPVFIPRPETEELVSFVVDAFSSKMKPVEQGKLADQEASLTDNVGIVAGEAECHAPTSLHPVILDVGCGSGAISLSILKKLPQSFVISVDKGEAAINLTRENASRLKLEDRIHVLLHNILLDPLEELLTWAPVDIIVSNPPYIFEEDMRDLAPEILRYEDPGALNGGVDGLLVIKAILLHTPQLLKNSGSIFLEVDPRHPEMVHRWLETRPDLRLQLIAVHQDFCGKPRFLHLQKRK